MNRLFVGHREMVSLTFRARDESERRRVPIRQGVVLAMALISTVLHMACGQRIADDTPRELIKSGIEGNVLIGPIGPHAKGAEEATRPYRARITVLDSDGNFVVTIQTNDDGTFRAPLRAGTYTLVPEPSFPDRPLPSARKQTVMVPQDAFRSVTIHYDTGIR